MIRAVLASAVVAACVVAAARDLVADRARPVVVGHPVLAAQLAQAIGLDVNSTSATVAANKLVGVKATVGMSANSTPGYQGPQPQGGP